MFLGRTLYFHSSSLHPGVLNGVPENFQGNLMKRRYLHTVFMEFFVIRVRCLFEGGAYLKSNLFLGNNSMVTDHFK